MEFRDSIAKAVELLLPGVQIKAPLTAKSKLNKNFENVIGKANYLGLTRIEK